MTKPTRDSRKKTSVPWSGQALENIRERLSKTPATSKPRTPSGPGTVSSQKGGHNTGSTKSEEEIFRAAMADVRELPEFHRLQHRSRRVTGVRTNVPSTDLDSTFIAELTAEDGVSFRHTDEYMAGCRAGIRSDICLDLNAGRIPAQDHLDMHGMSLEEAKVALERFIRESRHRGLRCVNIIHGRGLRSPEGPVLKEGLRKWLETGPFRKWVLAYATAPRKQGGPGATYLLLR